MHRYREVESRSMGQQKLALAARVPLVLTTRSQAFSMAIAHFSCRDRCMAWFPLTRKQKFHLLKLQKRLFWSFSFSAKVDSQVLVGSPR